MTPITPAQDLAEENVLARICENYERLRQYVLQGCSLPVRAYGLSVLMRQGMRAWMEASLEYGQPEAFSMVDEAQIWRTLCPPIQKELCGMLATIVLNRSKGKVEESCKPI